MGMWAAQCHCPATRAIVKPGGARSAPTSTKCIDVMRGRHGEGATRRSLSGSACVPACAPDRLLNHGVGEKLFEGAARVAQLLEMIPAHAYGDALRVVADQPSEDAQLEKRRVPQNRRPADGELHVGSIWHALRGMKQNAAAADVSRLADARGNKLVFIDDSKFQIQLNGVAPLQATVALDRVFRHVGLLESPIIRQKCT